MLRLALAGRPNAGEPWFFNAATLADADIADHRFTQIHQNRG